MLGYGDHHWAVRLLPFAWRIVPRWMKPGWPSRSRSRQVNAAQRHADQCTPSRLASLLIVRLAVLACA